jgi:hypothetical protein
MANRRELGANSRLWWMAAAAGALRFSCGCHYRIHATIRDAWARARRRVLAAMFALSALACSGARPWPATVQEAAQRVASELDAQSKERVRTTKKDDLIQYHFGWGMGIRNQFGLWRGNHKLLNSCGNGEAIHPDECSMIIIEAVWTLLQSPAAPAGASKLDTVAR